MVALKNPSDLADDLALLASALELLGLDEVDPSLEGARRSRERLVRSIRHYLIPRVSDRSAPLTVVFAGPTGSGKSTLVNSLAGLEVSATGPIRPTTREPVVLVSESHAPEFSRISEIDCHVVTGRAPILSQLALVDTPDIDSTSVEHRVAAEILIDNADIVVFVTSALRYADRVPWEVLRRAISRGAPMIQVLNRVTAGSWGALVDFRARLAEEGLDEEIVRVAEHRLGPASRRVPAAAIRELRRRLVDVARRMDRTREEAFGRVLDSTVDEIVDLADALDVMHQGGEMRREGVRSMFGAAARRVDFGGLWDDVAPADPPRGRMGRSWWRLRNRMTPARWEQIGAVVRRRLVARVEANVRRLAFPAVTDVEVVASIAGQTRTMATAAVDSWLDQVGRLVPGGAFAAHVVAHSATQGVPTPAFLALFEDESVVVRAYRGLASRLEVVYEQIGERVATIMEGSTIDPVHTDRLREVAAAVVVRSHFADA